MDETNFQWLIDGVTTVDQFSWHGGDAGLLRNIVPGWSPTDETTYGYPHYMTLDMSRSARYSRLKLWMRPRLPIFSAPTFTVFERILLLYKHVIQYVTLFFNVLIRNSAPLYVITFVYFSCINDYKNPKIIYITYIRNIYEKFRKIQIA